MAGSLLRAALGMQILSQFDQFKSHKFSSTNKCLFNVLFYSISSVPTDKWCRRKSSPAAGGKRMEKNEESVILNNTWRHGEYLKRKRMNYIKEFRHSTTAFGKINVLKMTKSFIRQRTDTFEHKFTPTQPLSRHFPLNFYFFTAIAFVPASSIFKSFWNTFTEGSSQFFFWSNPSAEQCFVVTWIVMKFSRLFFVGSVGGALRVLRLGRWTSSSFRRFHGDFGDKNEGSLCQHDCRCWFFSSKTCRKE